MGLKKGTQKKIKVDPVRRTQPQPEPKEPVKAPEREKEKV